MFHKIVLPSLMGCTLSTSIMLIGNGGYFMAAYLVFCIIMGAMECGRKNEEDKGKL